MPVLVLLVARGSASRSRLCRRAVDRLPMRAPRANGEKVCFRDRPGRHLGDHLIVNSQHDLDAAGLEPLDRSRKQVSSRALHRVLDESAEPSPVIRPFSVRIVFEQHVWIAVLEFVARHQTRLRIGDLASGGQHQGEVAVGKSRHDSASGRRLAGADGDADRACEFSPVGGRLRMRLPPGIDVGPELLVGALVVRGNAPPSSH